MKWNRIRIKFYCLNVTVVCSFCSFNSAIEAQCHLRFQFTLQKTEIWTGWLSYFHHGKKLSFLLILFYLELLIQLLTQCKLFRKGNGHCSTLSNIFPAFQFTHPPPPIFVHVVLRQCNNYVFLQVILIVVLIFGLSWLPLHIQSLVAMYGTLPRGKYGITLAFQLQDLTKLSTSI